MARWQGRRDLASPSPAGGGETINMTVAPYVLLAFTILLSSFISGVFGMAGGMILLGVLLNYFDVASAMILFSIIQFCANGWRAYRWRDYVRWPLVHTYVGGAVLAVR